jgi:putative ABC transport system permease protein
MFRMFLRTQWRIIRNRKIYYFVNVLGLSLGIASSLLIMLWIVDEHSYEKMHANAGKINQLYKEYSMGDELQVNSSLPMPLAATLESDFPEISSTVRVVRYRSFVRTGDEVYNEDNICVADPGYFQLFTFPFIQGDPASALDEPNSLVLTEEKAEKYFGKEDPMGKTLLFDGQMVFTVRGVMKNITSNTELDFDMVIPFETIYPPGCPDDSWYNHFVEIYIYLESAPVRDSLNARLTSHLQHYMEEDTDTKLLAQPIRDRYLNNPESKTPRRHYVRIFTIIAVLVLLIACINFINVSTFVSLNRSREIGIRKINGGGRKKLVLQYYGETLHQTLVAFLVAMVLVEVIRPQFNQLTGKNIVIPYLEPWFLLGCFGILLVTTLVAGTYPALLISAFRPIDAFQGRISSGKGQARFRTGLLVLQFVISVGLIISSLTILRQLGYMLNKDLGFDQENLVYLSLKDVHQKNFDVFREKVCTHNQILNMCRSSFLPTSVWGIIRGLDWEGKTGDQVSAFSFISSDYDLVRTLGLEVISGRDFDRDFPADSDKVLINEEAARFMGFTDPVGKAFEGDSSRIEIIGMFRDFHGLPLTEPIEPMLICMWPEMYFYALLRLGPGNPRDALDHLEKVWKELYPGIPVEYNFMDQRIENQYRSESRLGRLSGTFAILAILITCIGLFATAGHSAKKREREMAVRKAMGASTGSLVRYFVLDYMKWVLIANAVAWPVSWLLMHRWLENFAYRASLSPAIFVLAVLISAGIAMLTIAWHAFSSSRTNPANVLKWE